jgi:hypothetical protein
VLLSDRSAFPLHRRHVVERGAACATCHDAHGVSVAAGNARENAHLISFNVAVVGAAPDGRLGYTAQGSRHGSCALTCHGVPHDDIRSRY